MDPRQKKKVSQRGRRVRTPRGKKMKTSQLRKARNVPSALRGKSRGEEKAPCHRKRGKCPEKGNGENPFILGGS